MGQLLKREAEPFDFDDCQTIDKHDASPLNIFFSPCKLIAPRVAELNML
jgi:hypothetical protein